jgi:hypothetical protein
LRLLEVCKLKLSIFYNIIIEWAIAVALSYQFSHWRFVLLPSARRLSLPNRILLLGAAMSCPLNLVPLNRTQSSQMRSTMILMRMISARGQWEETRTLPPCFPFDPSSLNSTNTTTNTSSARPPPSNSPSSTTWKMTASFPMKSSSTCR